MQAPGQLGVYFAVLRKHLVVLAVSAALVVAAGVFYVIRQQPVFLSTATLEVRTPPRNLAAGGEYAEALAREQDELQTEVVLLKQTGTLAQQALEKLAAQNVDLAAGDYSEATLMRRVRIETVPGTHLVTFSLTGPDSDSLPKAVNAYAEVFQAWTEGKSAKTYDRQLDAFQRKVDVAEKSLKDVQVQLGKLDAENKELNLRAGENTPASVLRELRARMPSIEREMESDAAAKAAILDALTEAGITATKTGDRYALAAGEGSEAAASRLASDEHVVALPCVAGNSVVGEWLRIEKMALLRDQNMAELREDRPERIAAKKEAADARLRRGKAIDGVVTSELKRLDAQTRSNEKLVAGVKGQETEAARVGELINAYRAVQDLVDERKRALDLASNELKSFQGSLFHEADASGGASRATRRIVMATPALGAEQIAPKVPLIIGLTAFAAVAAGLGLVLLLEYLDDTIKSREDFDRYVGLPFLGFIPRIDVKDSTNPDLAADARSGTAIAEAFRAVRTSILFSRSDKPVRTILVTSAGPGEGKTTVASNLAITLAKHKGPVLLVDADLRRPRIAKALGVENKIGLTNYLIGEATLEQVVQKTTVEGLFAITSGPVPPNPAELLHGEKLAELLKAGLERFDRIVIDSPPVIAVSDARVIARCVDGLYLVISMGKTSWRLIQRSLESLTTIGFEVHGAILNNLSAPTGRYGYYYYRDYNYGKGYYVQPNTAKPAATTET